MKKLLPVFLSVVLALTLFSCAKEYSLENSSDPTGNGTIIGVDCRINKLSFLDTAGAGTPLGSLTAAINSSDRVTNITAFDSVSFTIDFVSTPFYASDTVFIDADEYFLVDLATQRIRQLHALVDPTDPFSTQYEVYYFYDGSGYLIQKFYAFTSNPGIPFYLVEYTHSNGKMVHMTGTDLFTGLGVDLARQRIVVVKSSQHFHAAYAPLARAVIYLDSPGSVTQDIRALPYRKVPRPRWPL